MLQIGVFLDKFLCVFVVGKFLQEPGLSEEEGFYLEQIVAVFVDGGKGDLSGPELEGIAVYSETEVAGKGDEEGGFPVIRITLKYGADKNEKVITGLKRISKPGLRVYASSENVPKVFGGLGTAIISTNQGVITDKAARKLGIGGEVLCYIW